MTRPSRTTRWRLALGGAGGLAVAWGALGLVRDAAATRPVQLALWLAGGVLAHDLLLSPLVAAAGALVARLVPARARPAVQGGLIVGGVLVLVALPVLLAAGRPHDVSRLPRDYLAGVLVALGLVATGTLVLTLAHRRPR